MKNCFRTRAVFFITPILVLVLVGVFCWTLHQNTRSPKSIPKRDRQVLERFFRELVAQEDFGYTFFGDKPVSTTGYFDPLPAENCFYGRSNRILQEGWSIWKRYHALFPMKNLLLFEEPHDDSTLKTITLINKSAFEETINTHIDLFKQVLGQEISAKDLLEKLQEHQVGLLDILKHHEGLYGILLGYGKENALLFQRRMALNIYNPHPTVSLSMVPRKGYSTLGEEIAFLKNHLDVIGGNTHPLCPIALPVFLGIRESTETMKLTKRYLSTRNEIIKLFFDANFLDHVLLCLQ